MATMAATNATANRAPSATTLYFLVFLLCCFLLSGIIIGVDLLSGLPDGWSKSLSAEGTMACWWMYYRVGLKETRADDCRGLVDSNTALYRR